MVLYCKECGEKERFYNTLSGYVNYTEDEIVDKYGEVQDWDNRDEGDGEQTEEDGPFCGNCSCSVEELTPEEIMEYDEEYAEELEDEENKRSGIVKKRTLKNIIGDKIDNRKIE